MLEKHCIWMKNSIYGAFLRSKRNFFRKTAPKKENNKV